MTPRRNTTRGAPGSAPPDQLRRRFDDHARHLFAIAVAVSGDRSTAEDLVHEALLRLHRTPEPPPPERERAYLRRIVVNLAADHHRSNERRARTAEAVAHATSATSVSAETDALDAERERLVAAAVATLPERQRDCVVLHYFAGLTETQIAAELDIAVGSVKSHLHRGRAALANALEELR